MSHKFSLRFFTLAIFVASLVFSLELWAQDQGSPSAEQQEPAAKPLAKQGEGPAASDPSKKNKNPWLSSAQGLGLYYGNTLLFIDSFTPNSKNATVKSGYGHGAGLFYFAIFNPVEIFVGLEFDRLNTSTNPNLYLFLGLGYQALSLNFYSLLFEIIGGGGSSLTFYQSSTVDIFGRQYLNYTPEAINWFAQFNVRNVFHIAPLLSLALTIGVRGAWFIPRDPGLGGTYTRLDFPIGVGFSLSFPTRPPPYYPRTY